MVVAHLNPTVAISVNSHVCIWQGYDGLYIFDGRTLQPIHEDINNFFDKRNSNSINLSEIENSIGFFDDQNQEYHWIFMSGSSSTLNEEWVYDFTKQRFYEVNRGSTKKLQAGTQVRDTSGNVYNYGSIDTGYLERLEYGNTFDGDDMTFTYQIGDILLENSFMIETTIRKIKVGVVAKSTTTNKITMTHYGNSKDTGSEKIIGTDVSGQRVSDILKGDDWGPFSTHSFKGSITTNNEAIGFEPLYIGLAYKIIRIDLK